MLSKELLLAIEERSSRITPGPWTWSCYRRGYEIVTMSYKGKVVRQDGGVCFVRDADFISHAREDIPAMLTTIRDLEIALEAAQKEGHG